MGREFSCAVLVFVFLGSFMSAMASFPVADMTVLGSVVTNVGGTIMDNTTWTLENSPYFLIDDVTIAPNATLTIEPGVAVDLDFWQLYVKGTLRAIGNETNRINITTVESPLTNNNRILFDDASSPWNETAGTGCTIQYALVNIISREQVVLPFAVALRNCQTTSCISNAMTRGYLRVVWS